MTENHVRPKTPLSKTKVSAKLAAAWARVSAGSKGAFADKLEVSSKCIDRALTGETLPELHTALNSLVFDPTALDEVLTEYGFKLTPCKADAANDMALVTGLSGTVAEYLQRIADGKRCHIDTAVLAELFRPLIPQMQAIVDEHDKRRAS